MKITHDAPFMTFIAGIKNARLEDSITRYRQNDTSFGSDGTWDATGTQALPWPRVFRKTSASLGSAWCSVHLLHPSEPETLNPAAPRPVA